MNFVGRKKEIGAVKRSLLQGQNIILTGRFGVGRSSLVRQISKLYAGTWNFLLRKETTGGLSRVIFLDNLVKITKQKLDFIRDIRLDGQLQFIAIAESGFGKIMLHPHATTLRHGL